MPEQYSPGKIVKNYRVERYLSSGNYANAYEATDMSDNKKIFLKQYSDPTKMMGDIFQRFVKQQRELKVVLDSIDEAEKIYETFEDEEYGIHHQAKEMMAGRDLRSYFNENPNITLNERSLVAAVALHALIKVHEKGIIHNDLKPEQIFLQMDPSIKMKYRVKLTDFDFSTIVGQYEPVYKVTTPFYSSPEFLKGNQTNLISDIFTMGIILYEVLTGDVPYSAVTPEEYEEQVLKYKVRKAKDLNSLLPDNTADLLYKMLDPKPEKRPKLEDMHQALIQFIKEGTELPPSPPPSPKLPVRIELVSGESSVTPSIHKTTLVGRDWCRIFTSYKYVSPEQFEVQKVSEIGRAHV